MTHWLMLVAQATQPTTTQAARPAGWEGIFAGPLVPILLAFGVFWWWMSRSRSKERQTYENMLKSLKRNDRVQTIGGVLGTVVDVRDNEVVLKVDEANNVKMRFNRTAIKEVLRDAANGGS